MEEKEEQRDMSEELNGKEMQTPEEAPEGTGFEGQDGEFDLDREMEALKQERDEKAKQCGEYLSMLQRTAAEFDNYKKRTAREKEGLYAEAVSDVVAAFLPVVDSIERAVKACEGESENKSLKEGVELVARQAIGVLQKLGVEEIKSVGESFNPEVHNAVMHIEDENAGPNVVVEEFQKGYIFKEKVIRHSMVKVAN